MLDLPNQYRSIKEEIDKAILEVLDSGAYINGPQVKEFEDNMSSFLGVKHAIGVASGSDALVLSLHALGIGSGDKVIVPTFTFFATAGAVSRLGATPVFVDIDPDTYNLDLNQVENLLKKDPAIKAIIPVHLFGLPCDMNCIMQLARKYNLCIIEDACQAIDADYYYPHENNSSEPFKIHCRPAPAKAGTIGHTGCFSFFPSKNLGCFGDGGMVVTNDDKIAEKLRILSVHGSSPKYFHKLVGYNSRMDTLQAAILNVKLKYLPHWTTGRKQVAAMYDTAFRAAGLENKIKWPELIPGHVFHQFIIKIEQRDVLATYLHEHGISTSIYYPLPLHQQECFANLQYKPGDLPLAEQACKHVLALPIDPEQTGDQIAYIIKYFKLFFENESAII